MEEGKETTTLKTANKHWAEAQFTSSLTPELSEPHIRRQSAA